MQQASLRTVETYCAAERESIYTGIQPFSIHRFLPHDIVACTDNVAIEEPLEIQLEFGPSAARNIRPISITMRTPGNDAELVAGFLLTEGVLRDADDIITISAPTDSLTVTPDATGTPARNAVRVSLAPDVALSLASLERNFYTTSSCGICGKASLLALRAVCPPRVSSTFAIDAAVLSKLPAILREQQQVFNRTGGLHACGLFDAAGSLHSLREDVGRHNALDKLLGAEFLADRTPLRDHMLLLSGRASFELLQKSVMAGIPLVAAIGAPSSLAVQVAREFDITLVGFLRGEGFNVYSGAHRIHSAQENG